MAEAVTCRKGDLHGIRNETYHKVLHEKYGKIRKITGLLGKKNLVMVFDPYEIEKLSVQENHLGSMIIVYVHLT
jgi:hypothetical protein